MRAAAVSTSPGSSGSCVVTISASAVVNASDTTSQKRTAPLGLASKTAGSALSLSGRGRITTCGNRPSSPAARNS